MSNTFLTALIQLVISLGGAGLVVQLLLLRQNRRKIAGEASTSEANAASTLSGAALTMVENAQSDAREARASEREAHVENDKLRTENERLRGDSHGKDWRIHHLEIREATLMNVLAKNNIPIPVIPPPQEQAGDRPPPKAIGGTPVPQI